MSKVFISYSHDCNEHKEKVLGLSERMREDGVSAWLDQYVAGTPEQGWPRWMMDQIDEAEHVLVICTENYYLRFRGHELPGKGKGGDWEGALITQEIYDKKSKTTKFVPVLFHSMDEAFVPEPVRCHTHYLLTTESRYEDLVDFLLGQSGIEPGPVGEPRRKERAKGARLNFGKERRLTAPKIAPSRVTHGAERLFGREEELAVLNKAWEASNINILSVVAIGGVGKTSLVVEWLNQCAAAGWLGVARVFDWSFYSMGTRENGDASSDSFMKAALDFFGDREMAESSASGWEKGSRLAELVAEEPTLLFLDGIEPLQYPPSQQSGKLKDPAIETLLKALARKNPGLCILTTRESVADLATFCTTTVTELSLDRLRTVAGAELLKHLGVHGSSADINKLVEDVKGHALTLNLLGRFLAEAHGGDVRSRDKVDFQEADAEVQGRHASRVIEAYEKWFLSEKREGRRLLAVLNLLALFDRPADFSCIEALRRTPAIPNLTDTLVDQGKEKWNITLSRLQRCGLIFVSSAPGCSVWSKGFMLDTHPIIRVYFAGKLKLQHEKAWKVGHRRLYQHLKDSSFHQSQPSLEDLLPLYQAVYHGCQAGMYRDAWMLHSKRISGEGQYAVRRLGAIGTDLSALACFFDQPWLHPSKKLDESSQGVVLGNAAFCLRAVGRLVEAMAPWKTGIEMAIRQQDWNTATLRALNLSELELTLGELNSSIVTCEKAIDLNSRCTNIFLKIGSLSSYGNALCHAGRFNEASEQFKEAERVKAEEDPDRPFLISVSGFEYCDFLLADVEPIVWQVLSLSASMEGTIDYCGICELVLARATAAIESMEDEKTVPILTVGLHYLSVAKATLFLAILKKKELRDVRPVMDKAVSSLRAAGQQQYVPNGLLSHSLLSFLEGNKEGARAVLYEAWDIAEKGPMRLHMSDVLLHRGRLFRNRQDIAEAGRLIQHCGYWRRKQELEDAAMAAQGWSGEDGAEFRGHLT